MAVKDLVSGTLAGNITTSTTNILVHIADNISAQGITDFFPTAPFYITIMPKSPAIGVANRLDSEILQVTAVGNDQVGNAALTCVRGQRDTTAKAFEAGSIVTVGVYTDDAVFLADSGVSGGSTYRKKLVDKDGNTIYPDVGVLETNNIADNAVTYKKASFTEYSTTEKVVGTWYNGKPIYRRVFSGTVSLTAETVADITLFGSGIDDIISAKGKWSYYNGFYAPVNVALNEGKVYSAIVQTAPGNMRLRFRTNYTLTSNYVVAVEYTKTTD